MTDRTVRVLLVMCAVVTVFVLIFSTVPEVH
jgi:hypothetical protein